MNRKVNVTLELFETSNSMWYVRKIDQYGSPLTIGLLYERTGHWQFSYTDMDGLELIGELGEGDNWHDDALLAISEFLGQMRPQQSQQQQAKHSAPKASIPTLREAVAIALSRKIQDMTGRAKCESMDKFCSRVKLFLRNQFDPMLGLVGSIETYLNRLKMAGKSTSYVRGMKSTLYGFMACLPTCQIDFLGGVR